VNIVQLMTAEGVFAPDFEDEIVAGSCVTHAGAIRHEPTRTQIEGVTVEGEH
jgi:NAD(P) transhydrogenase subunit alpha